MGYHDMAKVAERNSGGLFLMKFKEVLKTKHMIKSLEVHTVIMNLSSPVNTYAALPDACWARVLRTVPIQVTHPRKTGPEKCSCHNLAKSFGIGNFRVVIPL